MTKVEATFSQRSPQTPFERQRKLRANVLLIVVTMIWGSSFLIVQHALTFVGPFTFLAMRFGFAVLVLAFLFRKRLIHITSTEILSGSIIGLFLFASYAFQTVSLQYTTSSQAGFISGMYVPLVALLALANTTFGQEHLSNYDRSWRNTGTGLCPCKCIARNLY